MLYLSNIQHFSVGDGEGIRTTVFLKGCNLRCPWCHNPENLSKEPVTLRYPATGRVETLGRSATVRSLLPELLEDRAFYDESGGGVTFSGGEAMLQAEALAPLVRLLREQGVSSLVDTAGCVPYSAFRALNPYASGYLFDLKTADPARYRAIGGDLALVKDNLRRLLADGMAVTVRIPLIPDLNTSQQEIRRICEVLRDLEIDRAELLPFHRLGSAKYEAMGLAYAYRDRPPLAGDALRRIKEIYGRYLTVKTEE